MHSVIISDTSCLIVLDKLSQLEILKSLYGEVVITKEVKDEYELKLPTWVKVVEVNNYQNQLELEAKLDRGEASSIALSLEIENSLLIIDEAKGRKIAKQMGVDIIGSVGVLIQAKENGFIDDILELVSEMKIKGFRLSNGLMNSLKEKYGD